MTFMEDTRRISDSNFYKNFASTINNYKIKIREAAEKGRYTVDIPVTNESIFIADYFRDEGFTVKFYNKRIDESTTEYTMNIAWFKRSEEK